MRGREGASSGGRGASGRDAIAPLPQDSSRANTPKTPGVDDPRPEELNPSHPTPAQVADEERRAARYRELITRRARRTGGKVLSAPETFEEMAHDRRLRHDPESRP